MRQYWSRTWESPLPFLTPEQSLLVCTARQVAQERISPIARRIEESDDFPWDLVELYREMGWTSLLTPVAYEGGEAGTTEWCLVTEVIAKVSAECSSIIGGPNAISSMLRFMGSHDQQARWFPLLRERFPAFCASEPEAGSDIGAIRTTATERDGYYVINGYKQLISNAAVADLYVVLATVEPGSGGQGLRMFLVDGPATDGVRLERVDKLMGLRGGAVGALSFTDVEVPAADMIGSDQGISGLLRVMTMARPVTAAKAVGVAQGAMECALDYTLGRRQFDHVVFDFQGLSFMIADMATEIEAARELTYRAAAEVDRQDPRSGELASMAKLFATDMAMKVTTDAVQCLGGAGYSKEYPVERMMRDAKAFKIYEGTNQIQRRAIAEHLRRRWIGPKDT